jgi:uncharacterized protein with NAD-binding domain and iron-sulfur cluster
MAGLTAAWRLSEPEHRDEVDVTVYERGWYLGGKGASVRGLHNRIEEHGLHVWLGYYDNAFRLMRQVYDELDRPRTDPACPLTTWRDAFTPVDRLGMQDDSGESWSHWVASFTRRATEPGTDGQGGPLEVSQLLTRGLRLLLDFAASLPVASPEPASGLVLSPSPWHPSVRGLQPGQGPLNGLDVNAVLEIADTVRGLLPGSAPSGSSTRASAERMAALATAIASALASDPSLRRTRDFAGLVATCMAGTVADGLLTHPEGFAAIDHLDFREWLRRHGPSTQVADSPLIRAMYDLAFAYEDGDPNRPSMSAGLGLFLAGRLFFDYKGSIVWRMNAGMGEAVVAPLYQALAARGVTFRFFHRVLALHLDPTKSRVGAVSVSREALRAPGEAYQPLVRLDGLSCWPDAPLRQQLSEQASSGPAMTRECRLEAGVDFDDVVLAVPPAMSRLITHELVEHSAPWRHMVNGVKSVPTQSLQVWLREPMSALGWDEDCLVATGYAKPFESFAAMSHLLQREHWPPDNPVHSLGYFCSVLPADVARDPGTARETVRRNVDELLTGHVRRFWPAAVASDGDFVWDLLWAPDGQRGRERLEWQHWRANVDPSDQYVQAIPGTGAHRLRPDSSGYRNLFLAGDWVDSGLNAGCIEAAVMGGLEAANAVLGRPLMHDVVGEWYGVGPLG